MTKKLIERPTDVKAATNGAGEVSEREVLSQSAEQKRLVRLESKAAGLLEKINERTHKNTQDSIALGAVWAEIKQLRLWVHKASTWEQYCDEVFNLSYERVDQVIRASVSSSVLAEGLRLLVDEGQIEPMEIPTSERVLRELMRVRIEDGTPEEEARARAMVLVDAARLAGGRQPSNAHVRRVIETEGYIEAITSGKAIAARTRAEKLLESILQDVEQAVLLLNPDQFDALDKRIESAKRRIKRNASKAQA
jgi:hypothetical protein